MPMPDKLKQPATRRDLALTTKHLRAGLHHVRTGLDEVRGGLDEVRGGLNEVRGGLSDLGESVKRLAINQGSMEKRLEGVIKKGLAQLPSKEYIKKLMEETAVKGATYERKAESHGAILMDLTKRVGGHDSRISALERGQGPRQGP